VLRVGKSDLAQAYAYVEYGVGREQALAKCPWSPLYCPAHFPCCGGFNHPWGQQVFPDEWNPHANQVRGTSGEQFRPWLKRDDKTDIEVWSSLLLRALRFHNRDGETRNGHGIELLMFYPRQEFWDNATTRPSNARFYQWGPNGLINASAVQSGAPIFVSLPHFLRCDPGLLDAIDGLAPEPDKHELFLAIEPHTGMTFQEYVSRVRGKLTLSGISAS
jgi:hypothetical protein